MGGRAIDGVGDDERGLGGRQWQGRGGQSVEAGGGRGACGGSWPRRTSGRAGDRRALASGGLGGRGREQRVREKKRK